MGGSSNPVRVVVINTQYIETDARSFKSVVQSLTGKDSDSVQQAPAPAPVTNEAVLGRGMSFKDLDRMLRELPPLDELYTLLY